MSWSAPMTAVAGATFSAAQFNQYVRDNLNATAVALATAEGQFFMATGANALAARTGGGATVATSQTTTSTTYTNLLTVGPAATMNTGSVATVWFAAACSNNTTNAATDVSVAVSGSSSIAASDAWRTVLDGVTAGNISRYAGFHRFTGLTPGSNTFTVQYKVGSGTGTFADREIAVIPI